MQKPIVVVGSINLDLVVGAERLPGAGETVIGRTFDQFFGGKGANQAVAAAKLGYPVAMVGCVGSDAFGGPLREGLEANGVDTTCVSTVEGPSGVALITTSARGENSIVVVPGANGQVTPELLERSLPLLQRAGILLTQLEIPLDAVEYLGELAQRHGIPLMLDPAPARELSPSLLRRVSWLTPNESEMRELLQRAIDTEEECGAAVESFLAQGVKNVALKMGSHGVLIGAAERAKERVPAFAVEAVDTTAAGDAFNGGFAVGLMRDKTVRESVIYASAVAAISVTRRGAQPSMPSAEEVERFLADHGASLYTSTPPL